MKKNLRISIRGKVQGVFFRAATKATADQIGIKGYVKNLPDGSVLIEAEGDPIILDHFLEWCRSGPEHARVEDLDITEMLPQHYSNFEILKK